MPKTRINFGISDFMREWIKTQPNIQGIVEESQNHIVIQHTMTSPQRNSFKQNFLNRLDEDIPE